MKAESCVYDPIKGYLPCVDGWAILVDLIVLAVCGGLLGLAALAAALIVRIFRRKH